MKQFLRKIIAGQQSGIAVQLLKPFLKLLSWFYRTAVVLMCGLYHRGIFLRYHARRPVISVGNITAGGVGKTPLVMFLADYFLRRGRHPAVLIRGYMAAGQPSDEAAMMKERLAGVEIFVGRDRVAGAKQAQERADIIIMDDGFQHWPMERDLDIVVIDATDPFSNGELLPAGLLREPLSALKRADLFVLTRVDLGQDNLVNIRRALESIHPRCAVVETVHQPTGMTDLFTGANFTQMFVPGEKVTALCAIGAPASFEAQLKASGADVARMFAFEDHHSYSQQDLEPVIIFCRANHVSTVVTTHKDAVKLKAFRDVFRGLRLVVFQIDIKVVHGETELFSRLDRCSHS